LTRRCRQSRLHLGDAFADELSRTHQVCALGKKYLDR
jgi:hypothetical protein